MAWEAEMAGMATTLTHSRSQYRYGIAVRDRNGSASRLQGALAIAAGALWLAVWAHGLATHGGSALNEMKEFAALTWMDSGKFLVVPFVLLIPGFLFLAQRADRTRPSKAARIAGRAAAVVVAVAAVGTALQFWTFEWGSYRETFETKDGIAGAGGAIQSIASLLLTVVTGVLGIIAWRARAAPIWLIPVLVIGAFATVFLTPANFVPGIVWLTLGVWLLLRHGDGASPRREP